MGESKSPQESSSEGETKRKFREALDRKMAQSSSGSDHKDAAASSRGRTVRWRAVGNSAARAASHGARLLSGDPNVAEDAHQEVRPDSSTLRTCQICSLSKSRQPTRC